MATGSGSGFTGSSSGFRGMSVPETIQFSSNERDNSGVNQPTRQPYRAMQVPDRITLDEASSTMVSSPDPDPAQRPTVGDAPPTVLRNVAPTTTAPMSDMKSKEVTSTRVTPFHASQDMNNDGNEMSHRLLSLEDRVRRLETEVNQIGNQSGTGGPGRFWYVVTFAAWMMLPMTVAYMFYYRRNV